MKRFLCLVVLFAIGGCQVTMLSPDEKAKATQKKIMAESQEKIKVYKLLKEERQLSLDILKLEQELAKERQQVARPQLKPAPPEVKKE